MVEKGHHPGVDSETLLSLFLMKMIKTILDLCKVKEKNLTREEATLARKEQEDRFYNEFKKDLNKRIKQNCEYESSLMVELTGKVVYERRKDLVKEYHDVLGYDVVLIDDEVLGKGSDKSFMYVAWGKNPLKSLYTYDNK